MDSMYDRNYLYISKQQQQIIKNFPVLVAGCGIGSNISECALRMGFETMTIIDGDTIECSNLNRQNYVTEDLNNSKAESLKRRLLSINPTARITAHHVYLNQSNIPEFLKDIKVVINALDYDTSAPQFLDSHCRKLGIPVLHPYNLGWAGLLTILQSDGMSLESLRRDDNFNELTVVKYALEKLQSMDINTSWILELASKYVGMKDTKSPPQLSVGSWLVAAMCTDALFHIATGIQVDSFPEFYFSSIR